MPRVVVKTLSGANTIEIQTPSGSTTVKELRHLLVQKHDKFKGCKLLYNVRLTNIGCNHVLSHRCKLGVQAERWYHLTMQGISLSGETKIEDLDGIEGKFIVRAYSCF